ncbi:MAG: hypothetical protein IPN08_15665 [Bacteroidales bacterium]|nr:hypothetical protein [Bacteroidales bacterium]MBK9358795.1 hypothetical protein [Bacteroidales bacterium]
MKKVIIAFFTIAFIFSMSGTSLQAMTGDSGLYKAFYSNDKDPKTDGTKKDKKSDKKSSSCTSSCSDKSAKASGDCGSKKATSAEATAAPETK